MENSTNKQTISKISSSEESYIDFDLIIQFREKKFGINQDLNNLNGEIKKVFLSIYEILDLTNDDFIVLEDVQLHLLQVIDIEETKNLLMKLEVMEIIQMPSYHGYQIYPNYDLDFSWSEYTPSQLVSNLSTKQENLREKVKENVFKNKYGYYKKNQITFFKSVKDKIIVEQKIDPNTKIVNTSELTFSEINSVSIRLCKNDNLPFSGIVFSLFEDYIEKDLNGKLWALSTYKNGIQNGIEIFYWGNNNKIQTITDYKEGVEISRKEYSKDGNLKKNNENICYVEREKLIKSNLRQFGNFGAEHLKWVVKDVSTNTIVFTSDSASDCEQWIK